MKLRNKLISVLLAGTMLLTTSACAGNDNTSDIGTPPDYSAGAGREMQFYAYHGMNDGKYSEDGVTIDTGEDYRDLEHFSDYVNCGMQTFFLQQVQYQYGYVRGGAKEEYSSSDLKKYMDLAQEAGAEKTILIDWRLYRLSCQKTPLYKEDDLSGGAEVPYTAPDAATEAAVNLELNKDQPNYTFAKKSELRNYVISCLKEYEEHPVFWAVMLRDEPTWELFESAGTLFEIIRDYNPEIEVVQNLLPMYGEESLYHNVVAEGAKQRDVFYKEYLENWLNATGADYIMFDTYPIRYDGIETYQLKGLKIAADMCKEKGLELYVIMQTFAWLNNGIGVNRYCEKSDLYWQTNMLMGYGCTRIIFYTYFTIAGGNDRTSGMFNIDNTAFVNHYGEKTELYYNMQDIMKEIQDFAGVLLNFRYNASGTFKTLPLDDIVAYDYEQNDSFEKVNKVTVAQGDLALVTELYDSEKGNYMYMAENILDPAKGKLYDSSLEIELEFAEEFNYVAIYYKGGVRYEKLEDHKYKTILSAGYAEFLLPY